MYSLKLATLLFALFGTMSALQLCAQKNDQLKINQIQVIGTHNSYHAGFAPSAQKLWEERNPQGFSGLDYRHLPLDQQFDAGVRQIELDVFADGKGGRYAHPAGEAMIAAAHLPSDPDFDADGVMTKPGFKVIHMQDVDYRSTCQPFVACLEVVRRWSHAHPKHIPIFILVETKEGKSNNPAQPTEPEPFTTSTFDALDAEIQSVFPPAELIKPDDVRGHFETLNAAVLAGNWPTLNKACGKVIFLMDQRKVGPIYLADHPSLQGRVLFTNAEPGQPDAAFVELNDGPASEITDLVRKGYLVRTRTDADTREARTNSTTRRDAMMASGAQLLSTDYPSNEPARWPGHFVVKFPNDAIARCSPANTSEVCGVSEK
jgi:hypothetical protein